MYGTGGMCECGGDIEGAFDAGARGRDTGAAVRVRGRGGRWGYMQGGGICRGIDAKECAENRCRRNIKLVHA